MTTCGEYLIASSSQVHDNFTMGVNRKILINLIYFFYRRNISYVCKRTPINFLFTNYRYVFFKFLV